jgi:hypothetical protein
VVTLGSKTITIDNAHAVKPFGAIDKPGPGEETWNDSYVNYGWVLTPQPNMIPIDGSTITVVVDGVVLGHVVYNDFRSDIATLFPGYVNTDGAGGHCFLDVTKLNEGIHTISWNVTDSGGNSEGIGSRYFRVLNDSKLPDPSVLNEEPLQQDQGLESIKEFNPDESDIKTVEIKELERVQLPVANTLKGCMIVGNELRKLPIGSFLDKDSGVFYWQPGPGFVGEYRFVFIVKDANGQYTKKNIVVNIKPKN